LEVPVVLKPSAITEKILSIAKKQNCNVQVTVIEADSKYVCLRKGEIEQLVSSLAISTGVRLFKENRSIIISFSGDINTKDLEAKIEKSINDMIYLGKDKAKILLDKDQFSKGKLTPLQLDDKNFDNIRIPEVAQKLEKIEKQGLAVSDKIIPSEMAEFYGQRNKINITTSQGLSNSYSTSNYSFYYNAVAESKGQKEVEYWYEKNRSLDTLHFKGSIEGIGREAAERALRKLGGQKITSGDKAVVFSSRTASSLLRLLFYAVKGEDVLLKNSFLVDKLGKTIFSKNITIIDNPLIPKSQGSYPFDGEGRCGQEKRVVDKGKLLTYLHNSYSAQRLNMALTGNASTTISVAPGITCGNFYLMPGMGTQEDLIKEMKNGLLVESIFLSGMNNVTGDFSFGCSGFLIKNGRVTQPVKEITIAGNFLDLFNKVVQIADDDEHKTAVSSPAFLVSSLNIAGK
jgi:PmbA protein